MAAAVVGSILPVATSAQPAAAAADPNQAAIDRLLAKPSTAGRPGVETEVPALRTQRSTTFAQPDGTYRTRLSPTSTHYRDARGTWQPIDERLVADAGAEHGLRNGANRFSAKLPRKLTSPVVVSAEGATVSFALRGANAVGPLVSGRGTATYPAALPATDIRYDYTADEVKETMVLSSPVAPSRFNFSLTASAGVTPTAKDGGVVFVRPDGTAPMAFAPPSVVDAKGVPGPVAMRLEPADTVTVAVDPAWLSAEERAFPVSLDPTVTFASRTDVGGACELNSAYPDSFFCGYGPGGPYRAGVDGAATLRWAQRFDFGMAWSAVPSDAVVTSARLGAWVTATNLPNGFTPTFTARRVTSPWGQASWNHCCYPPNQESYWTPGGDFDATSADSQAPGNTSAPVSGTGPVFWYPTRAVQSQVAGKDFDANQGFIIKRSNEVGQGVVSFAHGSDTDPARRPYLEVTWSHRTGTKLAKFSKDVALNDRSGLKVNLGNGNAVVSATDAKVKGTGLDFSIERHYNAKADYAPEGLSRSAWSFSFGPWVKATRDDVGNTVTVRHADATQEVFVLAAASPPTYSSPPGAGATLVPVGSGYRLTDNRSGTSLEFGTTPNSVSLDGASVYLSKTIDRNANTITYNYNGSYAAQVASVTDTQGRTFTMEYQSPQFGLEYLTKINELDGSGRPGRSWSYHYTLGLLDAYTDATGATTTYGYDPSGRLADIATSSGQPDGRTSRVKLVYNADASVSKVQRVQNATGSSDDTTYAYRTGWDARHGSRCLNSGSGFLVTCTTETDPYNGPTSYGTDAMDQALKVVDPLARVRAGSYTANGDVATTTDAMATPGVTRNSYNNTTNNLESTQAPDVGGVGGSGRKSTLAYPPPQAPLTAAMYQPTKATDPQGNDTTFGYDSATRNLTSSTTNGTTRGWTYNADGTVAGQYDPGGSCAPGGTRCTRYAYAYAPSGPRVLTSVVTTPPAPLGQATTTFDAAGRASSLTDGKGKKTTNCYDAADRVTKVFYLSAAAPDCANGAADIAYTYDKLGNLMSRADNTGTTTFAYDWASRPTSKASSSGNSSATYDAVGRVTTYADAGGTVGYRYDAAGQLVALSEPGGNTSCTAGPRVLAPKCTSFAYDANGSRTTTVYPSGQAIIAAPDESGRVRSITAARPSGATFLSRSYTYTKASPTGQDQDVDLRRTTTDQNGAVTTYGYDAVNRLCSVYAGTTTSVGCTAPAGATTYAYDPSGNRTATRDAAGAVTSYGYNDANQLCWKAPGAQAGSACPAPAGGHHLRL